MKLATCSLLFAGVLHLVLGVESSRLENYQDLVDLLMEPRGNDAKPWSNNVYKSNRKYGADKAFDGNKWSYYCSNALKKGDAVYIMYDFGDGNKYSPSGIGWTKKGGARYGPDANKWEFIGYEKGCEDLKKKGTNGTLLCTKEPNSSSSSSSSSSCTALREGKFQCLGLKVEKSDKNNWIGLKEIQISEYVDFANGKAVANSIYSRSYSPKKAFDGTMGSYYCSELLSDETDTSEEFIYIMYDFGNAPVVPSGIEYTRQSNYGPETDKWEFVGYTKGCDFGTEPTILCTTISGNKASDEDSTVPVLAVDGPRTWMEERKRKGRKPVNEYKGRCVIRTKESFQCLGLRAKKGKSKYIGLKDIKITKSLIL